MTNMELIWVKANDFGALTNLKSEGLGCEEAEEFF